MHVCTYEMRDLPRWADAQGVFQLCLCIDTTYCNVQAFRPDRLATAMSSLVCSVLGLSSIKPAGAGLAALVESTSSSGQPLCMRAPSAMHRMLGLDPLENTWDKPL